MVRQSASSQAPFRLNGVCRQTSLPCVRFPLATVRHLHIVFPAHSNEPFLHDSPATRKGTFVLRLPKSPDNIGAKALMPSCNPASLSASPAETRHAMMGKHTRLSCHALFPCSRRCCFSLEAFATDEPTVTARPSIRFPHCPTQKAVSRQPSDWAAKKGGAC